MTRKLLQIILIWITFSATVLADNNPFNIILTYPLAAKNPDHLHGYRIAAGYQPKSLIWEKANIYFNLSYGHWWVSGTQNNHNINIYSLAPIVRLYVMKNTISPFFEASIGVSYLSRTRIGSRNLGIHFSFQDELGVGLAFGAEQRLAISLAALHYSNGSLSEHNSGITIPLILTVNYRF